MKKTSRRKFIGSAALLTTGAILRVDRLWAGPSYIPNLKENASKIAGVQIGMITYSFRDMPDQSAEALLGYIKEAGIGAIELMGNHAEGYLGAPTYSMDWAVMQPIWRKRNNKETLTAEEEAILKESDTKRKEYQESVKKWRMNASMDGFKKLRKMYNDAGVSIYAFKPDTFGAQNSDAEVEYGMKAGKTLGASHVTVERPSDEQTLRLGKLAEKTGMLIAYHGHEQQTPTFWDTALKQSPANRLNLDFGHFVAAGNEDPLGMVKAKHDKIASMHLKDRQTPAHGKNNVPWGEGDTPLVQVLQLMRDNKYKFPGTIELEYKVPEDSTPVKEVKRCLEFCQNALT